MDMSSPPVLEGPYISRNASGEALEVLQYIETLSLNEILNVTPDPYYYQNQSYLLMCNETMEYFLDVIDSGKSSSYSFNWSVSVAQSNTSPINTTDISQYWSNVSRSRSARYMSWWINGSQFVDYFDEVSSHYLVSRISSFEVKWIFYGKYDFGKDIHSDRCSWILAKQMIFLDENLEFVYFAYEEDRMVA
jgi:hypothetical protein